MPEQPTRTDTEYFNYWAAHFHDIQGLRLVFELKKNGKRRLVGLPALHRDPFDRMLICQALARDWHIASSDPLFKQYPVKLL